MVHCGIPYRPGKCKIKYNIIYIHGKTLWCIFRHLLRFLHSLLLKCIFRLIGHKNDSACKIINLNKIKQRETLYEDLESQHKVVSKGGIRYKEDVKVSCTVASSVVGSVSQTKRSPHKIWSNFNNILLETEPKAT